MHTTGGGNKLLSQSLKCVNFRPQQCTWVFSNSVYTYTSISLIPDTPLLPEDDLRGSTGWSYLNCVTSAFSAHARQHPLIKVAGNRFREGAAWWGARLANQSDSEQIHCIVCTTPWTFHVRDLKDAVFTDGRFGNHLYCRDPFESNSTEVEWEAGGWTGVLNIYC